MTNASELAQFAQPFVDAVKNVFQTMVGSEVRVLNSGKKEPNNISSGDISAMIGLLGEFEKPGKSIPYKAILLLSFPYETYFKVASAMLSETYTTYHPDIHDLGGELVNMIMGNAKRDLKTQGYTSNMAIPSMFEGKAHTMKYPNGTNILVFSLECSHGPLFMEICYAPAE